MNVPLDILGAGAFGTALAITYASAGHPVTLWGRGDMAALEATRENRRHLPGSRLPDTVRVTGDLAALDADIAIIALPTQSLAGFFAGHSVGAATLVSTAKGIDVASGRRPTEILADALPGRRLAQLTGPSFAADIARGLPTALTLACADEAAGEALQHDLSTPALRLYRSTDVIGAELGGALKNVIAVAAGAVIGAELGESARAALIARGFAEMRRIAVAAGARDATLSGLSGLGDLVLTCGSEKSRNFRAGVALARTEPLSPGDTIEGLHTARQLASRSDLDTPIADAVAALADGRSDLRTILDDLLSRPLKQE
jgi:glycerol-3-phosphate dehydrogenase (NAD(P)+)